MDSYNLIVKLKEENFLEEIEDEDFAEIEDKNLTKINLLLIESISFQCGSPLYTNNDVEQADYMLPYTYIANNLKLRIDSKFANISNYINIGTYCVDDSCPMCDDVWEYGFELLVDEHYWNNISFFSFVHSELVNLLKRTKNPSYYLPGTIIKDNYEVTILPSNTKTRRLGYLKLLIQMLNDRKKYAIMNFNRNFEKFVEPYNTFLSNYKNKKGIISVTKTGNSAKPYVELAECLGLVRKNNSYYELGKTGKVYLVLKNEIDKTKNNPFDLTTFDSGFFQEQLIKSDFLYIYSLIDLISKKDLVSYSALKSTYQNAVLTNIHEIVNNVKQINSQKALNIKMIERRIMSWEKPMKYLEHVLMPRINWLYDLGLIEYKNKSLFSLTSIGKELFLNLSLWKDLKMNFVVNPSGYLDMYYMSILNRQYSLNAKACTYIDIEMFVRYLENCFKTFKTIAPNRTTFSIASNYCKYSFLWNNATILEINYIKKLFETQLKDFYIYKYQNQYRDGYIQKR
ncbi:hypothetical protein [Prevotella nigrescens]|jgi:hypothetical protein